MLMPRLHTSPRGKGLSFDVYSISGTSTNFTSQQRRGAPNISYNYMHKKAQQKLQHIQEARGNKRQREEVERTDAGVQQQMHLNAEKTENVV